MLQTNQLRKHEINSTIGFNWKIVGSNFGNSIIKHEAELLSKVKMNLKELKKDQKLKYILNP